MMMSCCSLFFFFFLFSLHNQYNILQKNDGVFICVTMNDNEASDRASTR